MKEPSSNIFVSCRGQEDNLGDLVLRRTALRWIEDLGHTPVALVARLPQGFVDGLNLGKEAVRHGNSRSWLVSLLKESLVRPVTLLYAPGPQSLQMSGKGGAHSILNAIVVAFISIRGGRVVKIGRSIDPGSKIVMALEKLIARRTSFYTVRDQESLDLLDLPGIHVVPDLAWSGGLETYLHPNGDVARHRLSMCFRSDRVFNRSVVEALAFQARHRGLTPTLVTQVRRDNRFHRELAADLRCEHIEWAGDTPDDEQLRLVMRTYQESEAVVSNRLHSLIFGIIGGASPIGLAAAGDTKIQRSLAAAGIYDRVYDMNTPTPRDALNYIDLSGQVADARRCLKLDIERLATALRCEASAVDVGTP